MHSWVGLFKYMGVPKATGFGQATYKTKVAI